MMKWVLIAGVGAIAAALALEWLGARQWPETEAEELARIAAVPVTHDQEPAAAICAALAKVQPNPDAMLPYCAAVAAGTIVCTVDRGARTLSCGCDGAGWCAMRGEWTERAP